MIERLLNSLEGVRETGKNRWLAKCPAHDDRSPSLSLRETDDGRVLLHCFAGCDAEPILDALGLTFSDLYPEPLGHHFNRERTRFDARAALECVYHEALVVSVIADNLAHSVELSDCDHERLLLAASRLANAKDAATPLKRLR